MSKCTYVLNYHNK